MIYIKYNVDYYTTLAYIGDVKNNSFLEIVKEIKDEEKIKKEKDQIKLKYKDDARLRKNALECHRRKLNPNRKFEEILPENPSEDYVKYKGSHQNRKVIILQCNNCKLKFERALSEHNRQIKRNAEHVLCSKKCRSEYVTGIVRCEMISLICGYCKSNFKIRKNTYDGLIKNGNKNFYCNAQCYANSLKLDKIKVNCNNCKKELEKLPYQLNELNIYYCTKKCFWKGFERKRSKLEIYLESKIKEFFPDLKFITNDREICNGFELDFYFFELDFAIEINGIYHYKNIHGNNSLKNVQHHDKLKNQICKEKNIKLYTIKSIEDFAGKGIKHRDWKIFKNILMSKIPFCETKEDCISELYNPESNILNNLILNYGVRSDFYLRKLKKPKKFLIKNSKNEEYIPTSPQIEILHT